MKKICFYHFNPLELFPPAMNMLDYFSEQPADSQVIVFTTYPANGAPFNLPAREGKVRIIRIGLNDPKKPSVLRYLFYLRFYVISFFYSLIERPDIVFYIESISAPPALLLKKLNRSVKLAVHYHEYMSPEDYSRSAFRKLVYGFEKKMIRSYFRLSHTNKIRSALFLADLGMKEGELPLCEMPNYPKATWVGKNRKKIWSPSTPLKFVYAGAVGFEDLFFEEIFDWINAQSGNAELHIYSNQDTSMLSQYIVENSLRYIVFHEALPYKELPKALVVYDIGLILYKGEAENTRFNAPNKLFEYLSIGLDVWFHKGLQGVLPYVNRSSHPMILPLDFENLSKLSISMIYSDMPDKFEEVFYSSEVIYRGLWHDLIKE